MLIINWYSCTIFPSYYRLIVRFYLYFYFSSVSRTVSSIFVFDLLLWIICISPSLQSGRRAHFRMPRRSLRSDTVPPLLLPHAASVTLDKVAVLGLMSFWQTITLGPTRQPKAPGSIVASATVNHEGDPNLGAVAIRWHFAPIDFRSVILSENVKWMTPPSRTHFITSFSIIGATGRSHTLPFRFLSRRLSQRSFT